jgi:Lar family restriction alleviation protein
MITRTEIIMHYKNFFGIENMQLAEDDHLVVDWVESLIEDKKSAMCEANAHSVLSDVGELLPCPFCGSKAELKETDLGGYILWCTNYDCYVHGMHSHNKDEVIAAWNKRANVR